MKTLNYCIVMLLWATLSCVSEAQPEETIPKQLVGQWGSDQVVMNATRDIITFEFKCATGEISTDFVLKSDNTFSVRGTYTSAPGTIIAGRDPVPEETIYEGTVNGTQLKLTATTSDGDVLGNFSLVKGLSTKIQRCQ